MSVVCGDNEIFMFGVDWRRLANTHTLGPTQKAHQSNRKTTRWATKTHCLPHLIYEYLIRCIVSAMLLTIILLVVQFIRFWIIEHLDGRNVRHKIFRAGERSSLHIYDRICPNEPETVYMGFKVRQNYAVITMGLLFASAAIETSLRTRTTYIIFRSLQISNKILLLLNVSVDWYWVLVHALWSRTYTHTQNTFTQGDCWICSIGVEREKKTHERFVANICQMLLLFVFVYSFSHINNTRIECVFIHSICEIISISCAVPSELNTKCVIHGNRLNRGQKHDVQYEPIMFRATKTCERINTISCVTVNDARRYAYESNIR